MARRRAQISQTEEENDYAHDIVPRHTCNPTPAFEDPGQECDYDDAVGNAEVNVGLTYDPNYISRAENNFQRQATEDVIRMQLLANYVNGTADTSLAFEANTFDTHQSHGQFALAYPQSSSAEPIFDPNENVFDEFESMVEDQGTTFDQPDYGSQYRYPQSSLAESHFDPNEIRAGDFFNDSSSTNIITSELQSSENGADYAPDTPRTSDHLDGLEHILTYITDPPADFGFNASAQEDPVDLAHLLWSCPEGCGYVNADERQVQRHWARQHDPNAAMHPCTYEGCQWSFKEEKDLTRHIDNVHLELYRYSCQFCGAPQKRKDNCRRHESTCDMNPNRTTASGQRRRR